MDDEFIDGFCMVGWMDRWMKYWLIGKMYVWLPG